MDKDEIQRRKALAEGQIVFVETTHKEFGKISSKGVILHLRGKTKRLALVRLDGPVLGRYQVEALVPKRDIRWVNLFD